MTGKLAPEKEQDIVLPLHNWEALRQLEAEEREIERITKVVGATAVAAGLVNPAGYFILALAYRPLIRGSKIARIKKVMRVLLERFSSQSIQIFPCLQVEGSEPIDLFVILPEKVYLLISIRSKSKKEAKVVYKEDNETLYIRHELRGIRKWLPCPLVELSDHQSWLGKNRRQFGISANALRKFPVIKVLVLWEPMEIQKHESHLYTTIADSNFLKISRKGTALIVKETEIVELIEAQLSQLAS
jgi:hypothetical protein